MREMRSHAEQACLLLCAKVFHTQSNIFCRWYARVRVWNALYLYLVSDGYCIVCMRILHIPNDCSATGHLFLGWGGIRATTGELLPQNVSKGALCARLSTSGASVYIFQVWHVSQATPGLLNAWNVSKQKFNYSFLYFTWPWKPIQCNPRCCYASTYLWISSTWYSTHFRGK